jgi:hypothetical protein
MSKGRLICPDLDRLAAIFVGWRDVLKMIISDNISSGDTLFVNQLIYVQIYTASRNVNKPATGDAVISRASFNTYDSLPSS